MDAFVRRQAQDALPSSSPAFATPVHPVLPRDFSRPAPPVFKPIVDTPILPTLIPPPSLRPVAFRVFTKKHNLTISATSLATLATFIGRQCGSSWREEGTGEKVLEEVAKLWKSENGGVIVEDGKLLKNVLKTLEGSMIGGRIQPGSRTLSRESTFNFNQSSEPHVPTLQRAGSSFGLSGLSVEEPDDEDVSKDPLTWINVISAFEQPRLTFDVDKKHFVVSTTPASTFPPVTQKVTAFRDRYQQIYHRLLRNPAFQEPSISHRKVASLKRQGSAMTNQQFYRITPITNLLGRGGTSHLLLGMLAISPTGVLAIYDPDGSIALDLSNATPLQGKDSAYYVPGMVVLVDGMYEESWTGAGSTGLGGTGGVGGMIGGRFVAFGIGGPPVERREVSLGINLRAGDMGGGLGWTDFLGSGSEKAVGEKMRKLESRLLSPALSSALSPDLSAQEIDETRRMAVMMGEVDLTDPATLPAVRRILQEYSTRETLPLLFILTGNFTSKSALAGSGIGSIEYKALFDSLAAVLTDFPKLLQTSKWVFVPGDRDPWASSFSAGSSAIIPQQSIPDVLTSRVKRAFANAKSEGSAKDEGGVTWTSNPSRISMFGPAQEIVVFRDDMSSRFRRNAIKVGAAVEQHDSPMQDVDESEENGIPDSAEAQAVEEQAQTDKTSESFSIAQARKLVLSLLPQSNLAPFPTMIRPTHWSYQSALSLYPLPHTLVLADAEAEPFAVTFEGCHVINPGKVVGEGSRRKKAVWAEYDLWTKRGSIRDAWI